MNSFMYGPFYGAGHGVFPQPQVPVQNVQTRNVNPQVGQTPPMPRPNPMRPVNQPAPVQQAPGDQSSYASPELADALMRMSQQEADSPWEAVGNMAAAYAGRKQSERVRKQEEERAERERKREMEAYERKRRDAISDYRAKKGIDQEFGGGTEYGLNPVYGKDENGNTVLLQLNKSGNARQTAVPEGVQIMNGVEKMDAGTHWLLIDRRSGDVIGKQPKDVAGAEREKVLGESQGEGMRDLGGALQKAEQSLMLIDQLIAHPGRATGTGKSSVLDPRNYTPGTQAMDFHVMNRQLEGKAFLEAFESLKGGGHITEIEGKKATEAMARLSTSQSDEAYKAALMELRGIIELGMENARRRAGQGGAAAPTVNPASGGVRRTSTGAQWSIE